MSDSNEVRPPKKPAPGGDVILGLLFLIGIWILISPAMPGFTGWDWVAARVGGESVLLRVFIGFLFLYFVGLAREKNLIRDTVASMVREIRGYLSGTRERPPESVDLQLIPPLIAALRSDQPETCERARKELERLTGQHFGSDSAAWKVWLARKQNAPIQ